MEQAAVFMSNRSQTVRLPKSVALPDGVTRVDVLIIGRTRILIPAGEAWSSWFDEPGLSNDFERDQPMKQECEEF
jgi:antitoxin VapB